jgi:hypothetical protein
LGEFASFLLQWKVEVEISGRIKLFYNYLIKVKRQMRTVSKKGELKVTSHLGKYENEAQFVVIAHAIQTNDEGCAFKSIATAYLIVAQYPCLITVKR